MTVPTLAPKPGTPTVSQEHLPDRQSTPTSKYEENRGCRELVLESLSLPITAIR
jgi:hypothetical protein